MIIQLIRKYFDKRKTTNGREIHRTVVLPSKGGVLLGDYIYIGPNVFIDPKGKAKIGDGTIISSNVTILTSSHVLHKDVLPYGIESSLETTVLGKGCWIGIGSIILPGVELGDGVIVGAGSVVTKSFSDGVTIAGNPAKVISTRPINDQLVKNKAYLLKKFGKNRRSE